MHKVVFIPLAKNQSDFYEALANELPKNKYQSAFISCHERCARELKSRGWETYDFHKIKKELKKKVTFTEEKLWALAEKYDITPFNLFITHEREAFLINDRKILLRKFYYSLLSFEVIFDKLEKSENEYTIIQELGGFLSVLSSYFIAKKRNINNYFIEPSFFRGRMFFTKNSLSSPKIRTADLKDKNDIESFEKYIDDTLKNKKIVIPTKDKRHYRGVLQKFFNLQNAKRLVQKLYDKHILGLNEEFQYIGVHVQKNLNAIINKFKLKHLYSNIPDESFDYFPLHVPADFALTIRSPILFNQCHTIEQVAKMLPNGRVLCIKEHPAMLGAIPKKALGELLDRNQNIKLLNPKLNNYEVMSKANEIYTINSKSGAEAILLGKKVHLFGDAFYRGAPNTINYDSLEDFFTNKQVRIDAKSSDEVLNFFKSVWENSQEGDLYNLEETNLKKFSRSIQRLIEHE
jgi:hypothetical protein